MAATPFEILMNSFAWYVFLVFLGCEGAPPLSVWLLVAVVCLPLGPLGRLHHQLYKT